MRFTREHATEPARVPACPASALPSHAPLSSLGAPLSGTCPLTTRGLGASRDACSLYPAPCTPCLDAHGKRVASPPRVASTGTPHLPPTQPTVRTPSWLLSDGAASSTGGPIFEVVVPNGWVPGIHTHFQAQLGDVVAAIPVPEGCEPKTVLHVEAPKGTSKVDVVIPDDAVPGSQFVANVGGQLVNVPCPPHMKPGQMLSVAVAGDSALELGGVWVARPGKARGTPSRTGRLVPPLPSSAGGGRRGKPPAYAPSYEYNIDVGATGQGTTRGQDSPGRVHTGRGQESPGRRAQSPRQGSARQGSPRQGSPRQDSPGRNPQSSGRRPAPAPKRTSSPMSRAAQMLMPGSKGRRAL